uniref:Ig-like domain-containing protein n=1 Tax=Cyprinus carpio TaxID=7962 RepID=A0A8C1ZL23_CYPCA
MFHSFVVCCLCFWHLVGVFAGSDEVKSVIEGNSVTLESGLTEIKTDSEITWKFGQPETIISYINKEAKIFNTSDGPDGRFRGRLQLDHQTGSLTITDTRTTDSGLYQITISETTVTTNRFSVTVYARLPVPVISSNSSQCSSSSSSSSQQNCSLVCSVVNVSHVTLSWYKGNSLLSSISVSDLSISLSLPLEVEYQDKNTYSCVLNNSFTNQTQQLDLTQLCQTCADSFSLIELFSAAAAAGSLLIMAGFGIFCFYRKHRKTEQQGKCYRLTSTSIFVVNFP